MRALLTVCAVAALLMVQVAGTASWSSSLDSRAAVVDDGGASPPPLAFAASERAEVAYSSYVTGLIETPPSAHAVATADTAPRSAVSDEALTEVVQRLCAACHNDQLETGGLSLQGFDVAEAAKRVETAEKMITKLRLNMMPPPGIPRPGGDTLLALVETLESKVDASVALSPNPGVRLVQRLNRAEYERTIRRMLGLEIDASAFLPSETISDNFDNIADVQSMSPALLEGYMRAAGHVARLAVGDPRAAPVQSTYTTPRTTSQLEQVEGAPYGSRGGISVVHNFPADGEYVFDLELHREVEDFLFGRTARGERLELSINGERAALLEIDRWMSERDPQGLVVSTDPIFVRAGPHNVSAVFIPTREGPVNDLLSPIDHTMADPWIGRDLGITTVPHLRDLRIDGPHNATGVSHTPSRARIFSCRPTAPGEERPCAEEIIGRLAAEAYRRPLAPAELERLLGLYHEGVQEGSFETGIRTALQGVLSSPNFVFRFNRQPQDVGAGDVYQISDLALASRLSYFLWAEPPDEELAALAEDERLQDPQVLQDQVWRLLADPRSEALGTRFAAQWLRLPRLDVIHPDARRHPEFDDRLRDAMRRETELFFHSLVREDRSLLELFDSDYTFVNERLARHYGIPGIVGNEFRRVAVTNRRRGLFGHASVLTLTSHANRTSPVDRGKWVMEVLLGTSPPPPPPNVPDLEVTESEDTETGRTLTVRERMEMHRSNPTCNACHQFIDPLGLPLENWDVTGLWRTRDGGNPIDSRGELWDGTPVETPKDLRNALLNEMEIAVVRNFTENLMRYALGRRVQSYDKPVIRQIARDAAADQYRMSSFILGVVMSDQFRRQQAEPLAAEEPEADAGGIQP